MSNLQDNYKYWKEKEEMEKEGETQDNSIQDHCSDQDSIDADSGKTWSSLHLPGNTSYLPPC